MDLAGALGLDDRALVAFVGAGGKKTAMARLVEEGDSSGLTVGYTTTTHVPPPTIPLAVSEPEVLEVALAAQDPPVAFARDWVDDPERADRKLRGFEPAVVDWVFNTRRFDWLLVKADGARRREFKAPGPDEPVLPDAATLVVPTASVHAVGKPLTADHVHRPEAVAAVAGLLPGDEVGAEAVGTVLASPDGGCKAVPSSTSVVPLVNKADTPALRATARTVLAHAFDRSDRFDRGVVSSFRTGVWEVVTRDETG